MPVGKYRNFADCVIAQKKKGKSEPSAKRICGHIESQTKKARKK